MRGLGRFAQPMLHDPQRISLGVSLSALLIYLLLPTKMYYWDGVGFALTIEQAGSRLASLFHPNHLIYNLVGYLAWRGFAAIKISFRPLEVLQILNAFIAAGTVFVVFHTLYVFTKSLRRATEFAVLFALSATWWRFATDADAYIPSVFFLVLSYWFLLPGKTVRPVLVAVLHTAAMLLHQLALFFLPVAIVCLWHQRKEDQSRERAVLLYVSAVAMMTIGSYILAFFLSRPGNFWQWIATHSTDSHLSLKNPRSIYLTLRGTLRLFFGGKSAFWDMDVLTKTGTVILGITIILLLLSLLRLKRPNGSVQASYLKHIVNEKALLAWVVIYTFFLVFWLPQNTFYRLFYLPPLIFLAAIASGRTQRVRLSLLVTIMIVWNFTFLIYPYSRAASNEVLSFAERRSDEWRKNTAVAYANFHSDLWTISYFNPQVSWLNFSGDAEQMENLHSALQKRGMSLWLESTAYDALNISDSGKAWIKEHIDGERSLIYKSPAHEIRFFRLRD